MASGPRVARERAGPIYDRGPSLEGPLWFVALGALLWVAACGGRDGDSDGVLSELERLAFVPPGACVLDLGERTRVDCSTDAALLVDRFEVTREDWTGYLDSDPEGVAFPTAVRESWADRKLLDWPATFLTFDEARRFAAARGMRLPTPREWVRIAAGTREQRFPWGGGDAESIANTLELGLGRPTAVGTFEEGTTPNGIHDLLGNVWEWVDGRLPARPEGDGRTWAMGGSFAYRRRPIHGPRAGAPSSVPGSAGDGPTLEAFFNTLLLDPEHRADDLGLRCVVEAAPYLLERAARLGSGSRVRERCAAIGRRFGAAAVPLLSELAARPGAPPALQWMLEGARG